MKWEVGVITCPRPEKTIHTTLRSLEFAGWDYFTVFDDEELRGCYINWRRCASWSVVGDCDRVLICEDDIELSKGLRAHLESQPLPDGVVSLYTGAINHHDTPGWHKVEKLPKHCHGALATVWEPKLLSLFLQYDRSDEFRHGTDTHIGQWCRINKIPYWCHTPSFVRHIGTTSAVDSSWDEAQQEYRNCKEWIASV